MQLQLISDAGTILKTLEIAIIRNVGDDFIRPAHSVICFEILLNV